MAKLITATGKEFDCSFFGKAQGFILYTNITGLDYNEAHDIFANPEETKTIIYRDVINGEITNRVEKGFSVFVGIEYTFRVDGELQITLRRSFAEE